jgi:uncharacterized membrane protein YdcZ (DUF606 family)
VTAVAIALAIAAGLAGAVQAAVMGELGERTGVFPALAFPASFRSCSVSVSC